MPHATREWAVRKAEERSEPRCSRATPQGVRGRNSDNTKLREVLKWEPRVSLEEGLKRTYQWIRGEMAKHPEKYALDGGAASARRTAGGNAPTDLLLVDDAASEAVSATV